MKCSAPELTARFEWTHTRYGMGTLSALLLHLVMVHSEGARCLRLSETVSPAVNTVLSVESFLIESFAETAKKLLLFGICAVWSCRQVKD